MQSENLSTIQLAIKLKKIKRTDKKKNIAGIQI